MGNVSKIKVGNTWHQVKDAEARSQNAAHHTYYVAGTQTAATNLWTGNLPDVEALYEGLAIDYWLPFAGTGTAATLTLTLKGGNTVTADVYQTGTTRVTTHFAANSLMHFVYQTVTISNVERTGWWAVKPQDNNTTDIVNLQEGSAAYQADSAIYRYQLLFQTGENKLTPLNNSNNVVANTKAMLTSVDFDPFGKIYYYNSTTNIAAGGNMTTALYYHRNAVDLRYTFNCAQTLTAHKDLYLKVVPQGNGMVRIAADPCWTQSLPTSDDGYWYIYLGRTYSTYQFVLHTEHPVYYHDGTELRKLEGIQEASQSSAGLMSAADKLKLDTISGGGGSLPSGGTIGQVLAKRSATDGDAGWYSIHRLPSDKWYLPTGITEDQVLAAYRFIGAASEADALINVNEGAEYVLEKTSAVTWNAEKGIFIPGAKTQGLKNASLTGLYANLWSAAFGFSEASTASGNLAIGGIAPNYRRNLSIRAVASGGSTYYYNAPAINRYAGNTGCAYIANKYASGVLGGTWGAAAINDTYLYHDGVSQSFSDTGGNMSSNDIWGTAFVIGQNTVATPGSFYVTAVVWYNTVLTAAQHLELADTINALS